MSEIDNCSLMCQHGNVAFGKDAIRKMKRISKVRYFRNLC